MTFLVHIGYRLPVAHCSVYICCFFLQYSRFKIGYIILFSRSKTRGKWALDDDSVSCGKSPSTSLCQLHPSINGLVFFRPVSKNFAHLTLMGDSRSFQNFDFLIQVFTPVSFDTRHQTVVIGPPCGSAKACKVSGMDFHLLSTKLKIWQCGEVDFNVPSNVAMFLGLA